MRITRPFQDAGIERPLEAGQRYDLATVVASALIATGAAVRIDDEEPTEGASDPANTANETVTAATDSTSTSVPPPQTITTSGIGTASVTTTSASNGRGSRRGNA